MATATTPNVQNEEIDSSENSNDIDENSSANTDESDSLSENAKESEIDNTDENTASTATTDKLVPAEESDSDDDVQEIEDENLKNVIELSSEDESEQTLENESLQKALEETKAKVKLLKSTKLSRIIMKSGERLTKVEEPENSDGPHKFKLIKNFEQQKPFIRKMLRGQDEFIENCVIIDKDRKKTLIIRKYRRYVSKNKSGLEKASSNEGPVTKIVRKPAAKEPEIQFPKAIIYPKVSVEPKPTTTTSATTTAPTTTKPITGKLVPITKIDTPKFTIAKDSQGRPVTKILSIPASQINNPGFPKKFITIPIGNLKPVTSVASAGDSKIKPITISALSNKTSTSTTVSTSTTTTVKSENGTVVNDVNRKLPHISSKSLINKNPSTYTIKDGKITKIENAASLPTTKLLPTKGQTYVMRDGKIIGTNISVKQTTNVSNSQLPKSTTESRITVTIPSKKTNSTLNYRPIAPKPTTTKMPLDQFMKLLKKNELEIASNIKNQQCHPYINSVMPSLAKENSENSKVPAILQVHSNYQGDEDLLRMTQFQLPKKSILHELFKDDEMAEKLRAENRKRKMEKLVFGEESPATTEKEKAPPTPPVSSKRRRKEALIPMNVDFELLDEPEAQFVMPERPNVNLFLMSHLAKLQSLARALMTELDLSPIDFTTTLDYIKQYKYAKDHRDKTV